MRLPKINQLRKLLWHAEERQRIYNNRIHGLPWPWTKDVIFQRFRFCNTYRENDRVTAWWRDNWREPYKDHPNLWFAACVLRHINWPNTLDLIEFPEVWDPRAVLRKMDKARNSGEKVFTSAYLIGGGNAGGLPKTRYIVMNVLNPLYRAVAKAGGALWPAGANGMPATLQDAWQWFCSFFGFGKFIAYEVVTDLRHTRYLRNAPDIYTWANAGPGARRGLNRLYEREVNSAGAPAAKLLEELIAVSNWITENRDRSILPTWEARDTEHLLCEYWKYERAVMRLADGKVTGLENFRPPGLL
jgi:hypothetical protein